MPLQPSRTRLARRIRRLKANAVHASSTRRAATMSVRSMDVGALRSAPRGRGQRNFKLPTRACHRTLTYAGYKAYIGCSVGGAGWCAERRSRERLEAEMRSFDGAVAHDHDIAALVSVGGGERRTAPSLGVRSLML